MIFGLMIAGKRNNVAKPLQFFRSRNADEIQCTNAKYANDEVKSNGINYFCVSAANISVGGKKFSVFLKIK